MTSGSGYAVVTAVRGTNYALVRLTNQHSCDTSSGALGHAHFVSERMLEYQHGFLSFRFVNAHSHCELFSSSAIAVLGPTGEAGYLKCSRSFLCRFMPFNCSTSQVSFGLYIATRGSRPEETEALPACMSGLWTRDPKFSRFTLLVKYHAYMVHDIAGRSLP